MSDTVLLVVTGLLPPLLCPSKMTRAWLSVMIVLTAAVAGARGERNSGKSKGGATRTPTRTCNLRLKIVGATGVDDQYHWSEEVSKFLGVKDAGQADSFVKVRVGSIASAATICETHIIRNNEKPTWNTDCFGENAWDRKVYTATVVVTVNCLCGPTLNEACYVIAVARVCSSTDIYHTTTLTIPYSSITHPLTQPPTPR